MQLNPIDGHLDAVDADHQHLPKAFDNQLWSFDHLKPFALRMYVPLDGVGPVEIDVVVLFSNHCYSRELELGEDANEAHIVMDGGIRRVMDPDRYALSQTYLPALIHTLPERRIKPSRENFVTLELAPRAVGGLPRNYVVFFDVKKDRRRKKRLLLRVKSAYVLDRPFTKRERDEKTIGFHVLLKRVLNS